MNRESGKRTKKHEIHKWKMRVQVDSSTERNLKKAFPILEQVTESLGISLEVKETSIQLYRKLISNGATAGRSIGSMVGACIYAACRLRKYPIYIDEVSNSCGISVKKLSRRYRIVLRKLALDLPPHDPDIFLPRIASDLGISDAVYKKTEEILCKAREAYLFQGRDPGGVCVAAIYIAAIQCKEHIPQRDLALAGFITEVTLRNRYKDILKKLDLKLEY